MKTTLLNKIGIACVCVFIIQLIVRILVQQNNLNNISVLDRRTDIKNKVFKLNTIAADNEEISENKNLKYILLWTPSNTLPFIYMGEGQQGFIDRHCPFTNCFVTDDRNYLGDYTKFDVITFAGPQLVQMKNTILPSKRSPHQKYVFASLESPAYYPMCSKKFDDYFNWTWTYKLNSDARWGYIIVKDAQNNVIGPKIEMNWIQFQDMDPVSDEFKEQLKTKTKAAAWFVSNCYSKGGREIFVKQLQNELKKYNLTVDVYGRCGPLSCPTDKGDECNEMLRKDYYFYLSFENSFSEDYVTEKLLTGLNNSTVPIVYGGANYTRFMPNGIYLNARELGVEKLAAKMNELIKDPEQYAEYFRWKKYYSYHDSGLSLDDNDYCGFCAMLFDEELINKTTIYHKFRDWWNTPNRC